MGITMLRRTAIPVLFRIGQRGSPIDYFVHEGPVFSISLQPDNNGNVFATASDDGRILLFDTREDAPGKCMAQFMLPFHGVMFHPREPNVIATANARLGVHIWDIRKPKEILQHCCEDQGMAVRWNSSGTLLLCLRNLLPPLLLDPSDPSIQIEFDDETYYNACTMKSCCFAGDRDQYLLSGSDDFNVYMWKIPEPWPETQWVDSAHLVLRGHRSIVNQVRYCPNRDLIVSSGVEKIIKVWSPHMIPGSTGERDVASTCRPRLLCTADGCQRTAYLLLGESSPDSVEEDKQMIHFFDSLLRNEFEEESMGPPVPAGRHQLLVKRKKLLLSLTFSDSRPRACSLRPNLPDSGRTELQGSASDSSESSDSGLSHSRNSRLSPDSSSSFTIAETASSASVESSGSDSQPLPSSSHKDSGLNASSSSEEETVVVSRQKRNYRVKKRRRSSSESVE